MRVVHILTARVRNVWCNDSQPVDLQVFKLCRTEIKETDVREKKTPKDSTEIRHLEYHDAEVKMWITAK